MMFGLVVVGFGSQGDDGRGGLAVGGAHSGAAFAVAVVLDVGEEACVDGEDGGGWEVGGILAVGTGLTLVVDGTALLGDYYFCSRNGYAGAFFDHQNLQIAVGVLVAGRKNGCR